MSDVESEHAPVFRFVDGVGVEEVEALMEDEHARKDGKEVI